MCVCGCARVGYMCMWCVCVVCVVCVVQGQGNMILFGQARPSTCSIILINI